MLAIDRHKWHYAWTSTSGEDDVVCLVVNALDLYGI